MSTVNLPNIYCGMQAEMLQTLCTGAEAFTHSGTRGDTTEANWISWFRTYLPNRYAVDKAIIIDAHGNCSDKIDLVIYDAQYSPLVFKQNDNKLIPAESVYAVFEVKQDLNKAHMEYAQGKAKSVRSLQRSSVPIRHAGGQYAPKPLHEILAGILTTRSAWEAPIEHNVEKYLGINDHNKRLDFVCSISNSTFIVDNNIFIEDFDETAQPNIRFCEREKFLVFLLLNLLKRLQEVGTVPAINYSDYADSIDSDTM